MTEPHQKGITVAITPETLSKARKQLYEMTPQQLAEMEFVTDTKCGIAKPLESYYLKHGVMVG